MSEQQLVPPGLTYRQALKLARAHKPRSWDITGHFTCSCGYSHDGQRMAQDTAMAEHRQAVAKALVLIAGGWAPPAITESNDSRAADHDLVDCPRQGCRECVPEHGLSNRPGHEGRHDSSCPECNAWRHRLNQRIAATERLDAGRGMCHESCEALEACEDCGAPDETGIPEERFAYDCIGCGGSFTATRAGARNDPYCTELCRSEHEGRLPPCDTCDATLSQSSSPEWVHCATCGYSAKRHALLSARNANLDKLYDKSLDPRRRGRLSYHRCVSTMNVRADGQCDYVRMGNGDIRCRYCGVPEDGP